MLIQHLRRVVAIHRLAFPDSRSTRLGDVFVQRMYLWYLRFQPRLAFVAVHQGEIIGFVAGTLGAGGGQQRFKFTYWQIAWGFLCHPRCFLSRAMFESWRTYLKGVLLRRARQPAPPSSAGRKAALDSIAVHPAARGVHAGALLMAAFEQAAWSQGADYASLGVESDNHHARRMYERCGWALVHEDRTKNSANYRKFVH